jgi:hypothetical protein
LGSLVEERWRERNYDEEVFPKIAADALEEMDPTQALDPWEIVRWVNTTDSLLAQQGISSQFGNPPVTLYTSSRFFIDVYYWVDGTTSIHQHGFCGAFQVHLGSSIHSHYSFKTRHRLNQHFVIGDISLEKVELLEKGAIRRILPGEAYIHSLFHLDRPSATICIRTYKTYKGVPQYNFHKPYFGNDPFFEEHLTIRRTQCASLLFKIQHPETDAMIGELLSHSDFQTAFVILDLARSHLLGNHLEWTFGLSTGQERFESLMQIARRRHGELVNLIRPVFAEVNRQSHLVYRRGQITSPDHRFFLALLLNVPDRLKFLELVSSRYPDRDPVDTVTEWVEELASIKVTGSPEPNVLGISDYDDDYLLVFQCLLEGKTLDETKKSFEVEFSIEYAAELGSKPDQLYESIRNSLLFKTIFLEQTPSIIANQSLAVA